MDHYYEYLKRQHYLATHMELTEENVVRVLEELAPYVEADGGFLQFVEIEEETGYVKVRLGGACETWRQWRHPRRISPPGRDRRS